LKLRAVPAWAHLETLTQELAAIGFYLSGHPLDEYREALARLHVGRWSEFDAKVRAHGSCEARLAATVSNCQVRKSTAGNRFAFGGFSDPTGQFEAVIFSDTLDAAGELLEPGKAVLLSVEAELDGDAVKTRVTSVASLDHVLGRESRGLQIVADGSLALDEFIKLLKTDGSSLIQLKLKLPDTGREIEMSLGRRFELTPRSAGQLKSLPGVLAVERL
jgi:DNA polymerase-3 subunit alpha